MSDRAENPPKRDPEACWDPGILLGDVLTGAAAGALTGFLAEGVWAPPGAVVGAVGFAGAWAVKNAMRCGLSNTPNDGTGLLPDVHLFDSKPSHPTERVPHSRF
jgi:hypothetical protein